MTAVFVYQNISFANNAVSESFLFQSERGVDPGLFKKEGTGHLPVKSILFILLRMF